MHTPETPTDWMIYAVVTVLVYAIGSKFPLPLSVPQIMALIDKLRGKPASPAKPSDPLAPVIPDLPLSTGSPLLDLVRRVLLSNPNAGVFDLVVEAQNQRAIEQAELMEFNRQNEVLSRIVAALDPPSPPPSH